MPRDAVSRTANVKKQHLHGIFALSDGTAVNMIMIYYCQYFYFDTWKTKLIITWKVPCNMMITRVVAWIKDIFRRTSKHNHICIIT